MKLPRWALPEYPGIVVQFESRSLELLDHTLGEFAPGIVRGVFAQEPAEQVPAPGQGEADREHELSAERPGVH
jgi:hypothetical protein